MKLHDGFVVVCGGGKLPRMIANEMEAKKKKIYITNNKKLKLR